MGRRTGCRVLATLVAALAGAVLLSGSDQPVRAQPYPHWQELPAPPLSPRLDRIGVQLGHRLIVLGGRGGAIYDLQTGVWRPLRTPVPVSRRDQVVTAAGVAVLRHPRAGRTASWWILHPRSDTWSRMRHLPSRLSGSPSAFGSEVYVLSERRVAVYSTQLGRWTRLPADRLRPVLKDARVTASAAGTVVRGYAGRSRTPFTDRWNGVAWQRTPAGAADREAGGTWLLPPGVPRHGATSIRVGTRLVVVSGSHAWIHTP